MRAGDLEIIGCELALPMSLTLASGLMKAIAQECERQGYTNVVLLTAGPHTGKFAATPPGPDWEPPDADWDEEDDEG